MVNTARVQQKSVTSRGAVTAPRRLAGRITKPKALPRMTAKKLREQYGEQGWIFVDEPGAGDDGVAIELGGFFKLVRDPSSARDNGDWEGSFVTCFDFDEPPFERWLSVHAGPPQAHEAVGQPTGSQVPRVGSAAFACSRYGHSVVASAGAGCRAGALRRRLA